jgi:Transglycosylase SLT domain
MFSQSRTKKSETNKSFSTATQTKNKHKAIRKLNSTKTSPRKAAEIIQAVSFKQRLVYLVIESICLAAIISATSVIVLGNAAHWFTGTGILGNLFPFVVGVLILIIASSIFLVGWWQLRKVLRDRLVSLIPITAVCVACSFALVIGVANFNQSVDRFKVLVGGKEETQRITLIHQVFAAYRRYNSASLTKMIHRADNYRPAILAAATEYGIDPSLLEGIAATESSFRPRNSRDGGHGLFQITAVPSAVLKDTKNRLATENIDLDNAKTNAFIAAATFKHYLAEMNNNLYLALLAYNIGPANGGLRFIMKKYGVTDFITIQPYLQLLPRDYPTRVLSYALAFRIWQKHGQLLAYEQGNNALIIQQIGIPDLQ